QNFTILDTTDQLTAIRQVLRDLNVDTKQYEPRSVLNRISAAKNELITPEQFAEEADSFREEMHARIYEAYQKMIRSNQSLDFDDLIMQTVHLFNRVPEVYPITKEDSNIFMSMNIRIPTMPNMF